MKDQAEVCPLSRGVLSLAVHPLSIPLQDGIRVLRHLLPAPLSARLTAHVPSRERYGLTTFRLIAWMG